jgi:hypothetical protein
MTLAKSLVPIVLAAVACAALAGCGGSDSSATASTNTTITKAQLIKQGDAICRKTDTIQREALAAYTKKHGEPTAFGALGKMLAKVALPPIGTEIEELAALGAPKGDELQIEVIISGFEKALKGAEERPNTLLDSGEGEFARPDKLAGNYGFKDCAKAL